MVPFVIALFLLVALVVAVWLAYLWPGRQQGAPATSPPDLREGEPRHRREGPEWPAGP